MPKKAKAVKRPLDDGPVKHKSSEVDDLAAVARSNILKRKQWEIDAVRDLAAKLRESDPTPFDMKVVRVGPQLALVCSYADLHPMSIVIVDPGSNAYRYTVYTTPGSKGWSYGDTEAVVKDLKDWLTQ